MTTILYSSRIPTAIMQEHRELLSRILKRQLRAPNIEKLNAFVYQGNAVFSARINDKDRLLFSYMMYEERKTLIILAMTPHKYDRAYKQIAGLNPRYDIVQINDNDQDEKTNEPDECELPYLESDDRGEHLVRAHPYLNRHLVFSKEQDDALLQSRPLILSGPPGSGKTALLYQLHQMSKEDDPVLFVSQSRPLVDSLRQAYNEQNATYRAVRFTTWSDLLADSFSPKKAAAIDLFNRITDGFPRENPKIIHYELSLIAALGIDAYLASGRRQSYYSGNEHMQRALIEALDRWTSILEEVHCYDPMICVPNKHAPYKHVFCDEGQNLPPVALDFLIKSCAAQGSADVVVSLDTEQSLLTSPYVHDCLKVLLNASYVRYTEHQLKRTWRCPRAVTQVANALMNYKHKLDGGAQRRAYRDIESTHEHMGLVSYISPNQVTELVRYTQSSMAVLIVPDGLSEIEKKSVSEQLNTKNILTAAQAIGLDFETVIIYHPISKTHLKQEHQRGQPLSLEQNNAFNALYVSLTRAQSRVFIIEAPRFLDKLTSIIGLIQKNVFDLEQLHLLSQSEERDSWLTQVKFHVSERRFALARDLMTHHLKMDEQAIESTLARMSAKSGASEAPAALALSSAASAAKVARLRGARRGKKPAANNSFFSVKTNELIETMPDLNLNSEKCSGLPYTEMLPENPEPISGLPISSVGSISILNTMRKVSSDAATLKFLRKFLEQYNDPNTPIDVNQKRVNGLLSQERAIDNLFNHEIFPNKCLLACLLENPTLRALQSTIIATCATWSLPGVFASTFLNELIQWIDSLDTCSYMDFESEIKPAILFLFENTNIINYLFSNKHIEGASLFTRLLESPSLRGHQSLILSLCATKNLKGGVARVFFNQFIDWANSEDVDFEDEVKPVMVSLFANSNIIDYLFGDEYINGTLFIYLLVSPLMQTIVLQQCQDFCQRQFGTNRISDMKPDFFNKNLLEATIQTGDYRWSVLFLLTQTALGIETIASMPRLNDISLSALLESHNTPYQISSALHYLLMSLKGIELFVEIFKSNLLKLAPAPLLNQEQLFQRYYETPIGKRTLAHILLYPFDEKELPLDERSNVWFGSIATHVQENCIDLFLLMIGPDESLMVGLTHEMLWGIAEHNKPPLLCRLVMFIPSIAEGLVRRQSSLDFKLLWNPECYGENPSDSLLFLMALNRGLLLQLVQNIEPDPDFTHELIEKISNLWKGNRTAIVGEESDTFCLEGFLRTHYVAGATSRRIADGHYGLFTNPPPTCEATPTTPNQSTRRVSTPTPAPTPEHQPSRASAKPPQIQM